MCPGFGGDEGSGADRLRCRRRDGGLPKLPAAALLPGCPHRGAACSGAEQQLRNRRSRPAGIGAWDADSLVSKQAIDGTVRRYRQLGRDGEDVGTTAWVDGSALARKLCLTSSRSWHLIRPHRRRLFRMAALVISLNRVFDLA